MKNKSYILISGLILIGGGYFIYKKFYSPKALKLKYVDYIISSGNHANKDFISTFEEDFLYNWVNAIKNKQSTFTYKSKIHNTKGGTAVK